MLVRSDEALAASGAGDAIALETFESYAAGKRSDDRRGGKGAGKHRKPSKPEPTDVPDVVESGARATIWFVWCCIGVICIL